MTYFIQKRMNFEYEAWKAIAGGAAAICAGYLTLRKWLSRDALDRAMDRTGVGTIAFLQKTLEEERAARIAAETRADVFARERNDAIQKIGNLEGKISALSAEVQLLSQRLKRYVSSSDN